MMSLSRVWEQHKQSYVPDQLKNELRPTVVLTCVLLPSALLLLMYYHPGARSFTGIDYPWIPISLLFAAGAISLVQWRNWERQEQVQVLCLVDICLYCLAIVAVMLDSVSPTRYIWGLLYAQAAAHYGNRYSFSWPLLLSISIIPLLVTFAYAGEDYGLLALTLFGSVMYVVNSTMTSHVRKLEAEKERFRAAFEITDRVASDKLDIAIASSMAELGHFIHELRNAFTPMTGNLMILEEDKSLAPETREIVQSISRSQQRSSDIVERLLMRIKSRAVSPESSFSLCEVLDEPRLKDNLAPADRERVKLQGEIPDFELVGNHEYLSGAIANLVHNSLKANATVVFVSARLDGGLNRAIITISDDGPGLPDSIQDTLFMPRQEGSTQTNSHGLGLPISKRLVEILGGQILLEKTNREGTVFRIKVPGRYPLDADA